MRRPIVYILYIVIIVGLVAAIVYGFKHKTDTPKAPTASQKTSVNVAKQKAEAAAKQRQQQAAREAANAEATKQATQQAQVRAQVQAQSQAQANAQKLVNTGPADTFAVVTSSVVLGAAGYHLRQRRQLG